MANKNNNADLIEEKQALTAFFSSLLTDTDDDASQQKIENITNKEFKSITDVPETVFLPEIPQVISQQQIEIEKQPELNAIEPISEINIEQESLKVENQIIVETAPIIDETLQIMMFKTAGLTLAVPLIELSGVISWPDTVTEMPGHSESYLGIVQHLGKNIPIIDIAQIVFPHDRLNSVVDSASRNALNRIVFINNFEWGLACDEVNDVICINSEQIKWRQSASKRPWLAGTVVDHMCALLDTKELSRLLNTDHA